LATTIFLPLPFSFLQQSYTVISKLATTTSTRLASQLATQNGQTKMPSRCILIYSRSCPRIVHGHIPASPLWLADLDRPRPPTSEPACGSEDQNLQVKVSVGLVHRNSLGREGSCGELCKQDLQEVCTVTPDGFDKTCLGIITVEEVHNLAVRIETG
jgi:hypothetical protein